MAAICLLAREAAGKYEKLPPGEVTFGNSTILRTSQEELVRGIRIEGLPDRDDPAGLDYVEIILTYSSVPDQENLSTRLWAQEDHAFLSSPISLSSCAHIIRSTIFIPARKSNDSPELPTSESLNSRSKRSTEITTASYQKLSG